MQQQQQQQQSSAGTPRTVTSCTRRPRRHFAGEIRPARRWCASTPTAATRRVTSVSSQPTSQPPRARTSTNPSKSALSLPSMDARAICPVGEHDMLARCHHAPLTMPQHTAYRAKAWCRNVKERRHDIQYRASDVQAASPAVSLVAVQEANKACAAHPTLQPLRHHGMPLLPLRPKLKPSHAVAGTSTPSVR